jgi:hypothetical protein
MVADPSPIVCSDAHPLREYALKVQHVAGNPCLTSKAGISLHEFDAPAKVFSPGEILIKYEFSTVRLLWPVKGKC